jgi:hypothetical protein
MMRREMISPLGGSMSRKYNCTNAVEEDLYHIIITHVVYCVV